MQVYEGCIEEDDTRLDDGVAALLEAANAPEPFPEAVLDLSWVLILRGLPAMALSYAKRATELMPERRDAWAFYGHACVDRGDVDEAVRALEMACKQPDATDDDRALLKRLKNKEPLKRVGNVVSFFAGEMTDLHLQRVGEEEAQKYQLFIVRQLLKAEPENSALLYTSARLLYDLNQFDRALEMAERSVRLQPDHADSMALIGLIHQKSDRLEQSRHWYQRAIEADPDHVLANTNFAKQLLDQGMTAKARNYLNRALEADPNYATALQLYGISVAAIEQDYELEATYHRRALELEPGRSAFHVSLCLCYLQAGNFRALETAWRKGKQYIASIEEEFPLAKLIPVLLDPPYDPSLWDRILTVKDSLGGDAVRRAVERMLAGLPRYMPEQDWADAYAKVGMLAGQCHLHDVSLRAFLEAEKLLGRGSSASLNVAVALNWLGRNREAVERAREVEPSIPRAMTILGNLLSDAGELEEAFRCYLRAVHIDEGFMLPIERGTAVGIRLRQWEEVVDLQQALEFVEGQELECALTRARLHAARGLPWEVIDILGPVLSAMDADGSENGETPRLAELLREDLSDQEIQALLEQPDVFGGRDLTVVHSSNPVQDAWFLLAESFWACRKAARALSILQRGANQPEVRPDGDWSVLQAECRRQLSAQEAAQQMLSHMTPQPPPLISLAILDLASGNTSLAKERSQQAQQLEVTDRFYHHPMGQTRALEAALMTFAALDEGDINEAVEHGQHALEMDDTSAFAALAFMHALKAQGQAVEGLEIGHAALRTQPGEPELVRWCIETHLDLGELDNADALLQEQRGFMELRAADGLAAQLGETSVRMKLATVGEQSGQGVSQEQAADWPWLEDLQPAARHWLQTAVLHVDRMQWLKLGLAVYLCKVAEMELVHRLILPFGQEVSGDDVEHDGSLRDLSDYLESCRRPPSLGGIVQALRRGAERATHGDSRLLQRWRRYLWSRPWDGAQGLVSRQYLQRLERLKQARNRVAHLGDLSEEDFQDLYSFIVKDDRPGEFFHALGLHPESVAGESGGQ